MPKKIRVYELARELGLTNKEALDICIDLGIGVKSHSSSIEDAQADRARRKADREGLRRAVQPEEPSPAPSAAPAVTGPRGAGGSQRPTSAPAGERPGAAPPVPTPDPTGSAVGDKLVPRPEAEVASGTHEPRPGQRLVVSKSTSETIDAPRIAVPRVPVSPPLGAPRSAAGTGSVRPGTAPGGQRPGISPSPVAPRAPAPPTSASAAGTVAAPSAAPAVAVTPASQAPGVAAPERRVPPSSASTTTPLAPDVDHKVGSFRPVSPSGRPIPPPPGPRSISGRPIPPPPGTRRPIPPDGSAPRPGVPGSRPVAPGSRPAAPGSRPGMTQSRPGTVGSRPPAGRQVSPRPGTGAGFARSPGHFPPRDGGRPSGGTYGGGGAPGARSGGYTPGGPTGAARGGPVGRGRPPQRRPRRRRRNMEELEPIQVTAYLASSAPVPDHEVIVERGSTPQQLGPRLNRSAGDVVRFLLLQGEMVTATQPLTDDMIGLFAAEIGAQIRLVDPGEEQEAALRAKFFGGEEFEDDDEDLQVRPPVITVMGHVDHGKTLLLDRIRHSNVIAGEAGGITQHIGAYQVEWRGQLLTFIDTPGHEAFTAMRARGASVTDIVVLVVAADDGVMPQTVEAINHAKAAKVPIVTAINKIDRADADPNHVMQQLSEQGLVPEAWGGDTITVEISALQSFGIDELLEQLVVLAEVLELGADAEVDARGVVLESNLDIGRGPVATIIVQRGTLRVGDPIVAGAAWGRVKALINDHGDQIKEAFPSMPVQVLGLSEPPIAGDELRVTSDLSVARTVGDAREQRLRFTTLAQASTMSTSPGAKLEDLFEQIRKGETATLTLVLKADVQGSLEAVTQSLLKLERDDVKVSFVHRAVGGITESDVTIAAASGATIIGFNVRPDRRARELAESHKVEIRTYEIIYKLIEDVQAAMVGMLTPEIEEIVTGDAEVRAVFRVPKVGAVAGCYVTNGVIARGSKVRFLREGVVIWKGAVSSLRRFKDDVREVQAGFECGIGLTDFQDLKDGDVIETYDEREIPRT